jgi:hypothetical protein
LLVQLLGLIGILGCDFSSSTLTVDQPTVLSQLQTCSTISGSIAIATSFVGQASLDAIQKITVNLVAEDVPGLTSLTAPKLQTIQALTLNGLSGLTDLSIGSGVGSGTSISDELRISNTSITTLNNVKLAGGSAPKTVVIDASTTNMSAAADFLLNFTAIPGNLTINGIGGRTVSATAPLIIRLPALTSAGNLDVNLNVVDIEVPLLTYIPGVLRLDRLTSKISISFPNLARVGGSVLITNNPVLADVSMPQLASIDGNVGDGLTIQNNSLLSNVAGFPALESVPDVDISGNVSRYVHIELSNFRFVLGRFLTLITSIDFQILSNVTGYMKVNSTSHLDCTAIQAEAQDGGWNVRNFSCTDVNSTTTAPGGSIATQSSSPKESLSTGGKAGIAVGCIVGVALIGGVALWYFRRRRAVPMSTTQETAEISELPAEKADAELEAGHGKSELNGGGRRSGYTEAFELPGDQPKDKQIDD